MKPALGNYWLLCMMSLVLIVPKNFACCFEDATCAIVYLRREAPKIRAALKRLEERAGAQENSRLCFRDAGNYLQDYRYVSVKYKDGVVAKLQKAALNQWVYSQISPALTDSSCANDGYSVESVGLEDDPNTFEKVKSKPVIDKEPFFLQKLPPKSKKS